MKNFIVVFLSLFLIFFSLSCNKDEDSVIDPTEEVVLTLKFSFQYLSTDISLKKISAILKLSEESSSIITSNNANLSGRPDSFELVLRVSGESAREIIGKVVYISTEVFYTAGNEELSKEVNATVQIHGGTQSYNLSYELASLKSVEIIINLHFIYGNNTNIRDYVVYILKEDSDFTNPIREDLNFNFNDDPEKITVKFTLEGVEALEHIGKDRWIVVKVIFKHLSHWQSFFEKKEFIVQEGVQEFDFHFCYPPSACD